MLHAAFALTGVLTTMLGPLLPTLSARWNIGDARAGLLFTSQFVASMSGALLGARLAPRFGVRVMVSAGLALCAGGVAMLAAGNWTLGLAAVAVYGLGLGLVIPLINLLVSGLNPSRRPASLNLLNFAWGLGAVAAPPALAALVPRTGLPAVLWMLAALAALVAVLARPGGFTAVPETSRAAPERIWRHSWIWLTGVFLFFYVGIENGLAGWMPTYAARQVHASAAWMAGAQTAFWMAILGVRLLAPVLLRRLSPTRLIDSGLLLALAGMLLLLAVPRTGGLLAGALLAGSGLACVFPTAVALFTERAAALGARVTGIVFAMAALGGAAVPPAAGAISARSGSLRLGLMAPLACALIMIGMRLRAPRAIKTAAATGLPA